MSTELDAQAVADFLLSQPDFFVQHDELLQQLTIPHECGHSLSLLQYQTQRLRLRNAELTQQMQHMLEVARDNERLFEQTRRLVLDLLDADSFEALVGALDDHLRHVFHVPFTSLILLSDAPLAVGRSASQASIEAALGDILFRDGTLCGVLREPELAFLFGPESPSIGSAAVIAFHGDQLQGLLAVGSPDPNHYRSNFGTLFLRNIADILSRTLPALVKSATAHA